MQPITRRRLLQYGLGTGAALALSWTSRIPWAASASAGGKLTKYVQPVPLPGDGIVVATPPDPSEPNRYSFTQREISRRLHPQLPKTPVLMPGTSATARTRPRVRERSGSSAAAVRGLGATNVLARAELRYRPSAMAASTSAARSIVWGPLQKPARRSTVSLRSERPASTTSTS